MRKLLFTTLLVLSGALRLLAQTASDTAIYDVAEHMPYPLLKSCQPERHVGWTEDSIRRCAELQLLGLLSQNIRYPEAARQNNTEGTVVVSFVVEPNGKMSNFKLLKDIGDGCGEESLRVLQALEEVGLQWQPARNGDQPVRMRQSLPLRFKLQEALPYYLTDQGDTLYAVVDVGPAYKGGFDSLVAFTMNRLKYPASYVDSCKTGVIEMSLVIWDDGAVEVDNQIDFSNLGSEFQWEALRLANRTEGYWIPAQYGGKPVSTTIPLRVLFKSSGKACAAANERFDRATLLAEEGAERFDQNDLEGAIAKWTEALNLQPGNTEWLYYRGSALINLSRREEACKDFNMVKQILGLTWFETIRKLACGW